jgi:uncharacterized membrane protein (UPF0127 family)
MHFVNKIFLVIFLGAVGSLIFFVGIPYIENFDKSTLAERIAIEINTNNKRAILTRFGTTTLMIDLAVTNFEKEKGLGGSFFLSDNNGLLFVYDRDGYPAIWMKNMIFPIDIAWLNTDFRIVDIEKNVSPSSYPTAFRPDLPSRYVLEVNAGYFDLHGIDIGDMLELVEDDEIGV